MKTKHISPFPFTRLWRVFPVLLVMIIGAEVAAPAMAQSAADLLEQGIYTEQTVGDLSAAIEIYSRVVEDAEGNRPHIAQAQFRLGMCYLKKGDDAEARTALDQLIRNFPEQEQLVAQAREQLAGLQPALALEPAPWQDGEWLKYHIKLPTGKVMGTLQLMAWSTAVDGVDAWQLELRRFIIIDSDNYGVSRVLVDRDSQRPIRSTIRHGILGNADAVFGPDGVEITGAAGAAHAASEQEIYDNEQVMHLIRGLPLTPGYGIHLRVVPIWTAQVIDVGLKVTKTTSCRVPAGDFECYAIDLDLGQPGQDANRQKQKIWVSTGPERYPVKLKAEGVVFELVEIGRAEPGMPVTVSAEGFDFSTTLPAGWQFYERRPPGRSNKVAFRLLDPDAAAISSLEVDRCPRGRCPSLQETAEHELSGARERIEAYELREASWTERSIDGRPAISFVGDYRRNDQPWIQYRLYTLTDDMRFELIFRAPADRFEQLRTVFDSVAESLEAE